MAELERFPLVAGFRDVPAPSTDTGAAAMWQAIADTSSRITQRLFERAAKNASRQGELAGLEHGAGAALPQGVPRAAGPVSAAMKGSRQKAMAFFIGQGWSKEQAAGIVGNLMQESALRTDAANPRDPGTSIGLGQWNRDRKRAFLGFAASRGADWRDFDTQLAFVAHELATSESGVAARLRSAKTVEAATTAFIGYERPQGWTPGNPQGGHGFAYRLAYAQGALSLDLSEIPASAAPSPGGRPAAAGMVAHPAANQPAFTLTRAATVRGQAFDDAASRVYSDRLETQALTDMETIAAQHAGDPAATQQAIDQYRRDMRGQIPMEMRPGFDSLVGRHSIAYTRQAGRDHAAQLADDAEAAFLETYGAKRKAAIQLAARAGTDAAGNALVAQELQSLHDFVAGAQGLTPKERAALQRDLADDVTSARVLAAFENAGTPARRTAFAQALETAWNEGGGLARDMSPEAFARIRAQMGQVLTRDETAAAKRASAAGRRIDQVMSRLKNGYGIPEAERAGLKAEVAAAGDPGLAQEWTLFEGLANWQAANRAQPPAVIAAQIDAYERQIGEQGASAADVAALDVMKGLHRETVAGLDKDPLGWAARTGRIVLDPLDLSSPGAFAASLAVRADDARAVASIYGQAPRYFQPAEREALTRAMADNPDLLASFGLSLRQALGERDAPGALAEISKEAPVVAHVTGLAMMTGSDGFLRDTATALKARMVPDYKPVTLKPSLRPPLPALRFLPATEAAAAKSAELVFDLRMRQRGLDADSPEAVTLWADTLAEALGAHDDKGRTVGGLGTVNGVQVLLPPGMDADQMQDAMDGIDTAAMARLPPMANLNGFAVTPDELALGHPVAVGPGRYRLALGDPASAEPAYVMAPDGGFWEFDIARLTARGGGGGL